jgi:Domain of unknown function (DUF2437)
MRIVRYQNQSGQIEYGALNASGSIFKLRGDIFERPEMTDESAKVAKLLAPLQPEIKKNGKLTNPVVLEG